MSEGAVLALLPAAGVPPGAFHLRVLATSDVHAKLLAFDYYREQTTDGASLARLASLVEGLRQGADACLLVDNGDFLQGRPIAEIDHHTAVNAGNPVVLAMNQMGYDAVGLGNHEFDLDAPLMRASFAKADFPVLCSNLNPVADDPAYADIWQARTIVPLTLADVNGGVVAVKVGVFSVLPPQVVQWAASRIAGGLEASDIVEASRSQVAALRDEGADLVIALAHSGIGDGPFCPNMENAARYVADIEGVDAVVAGHVHERFPRASSSADTPNEESQIGLNGKPVVMPEAMATHLGKMDLYLERTQTPDHGDTWRVARFHCDVLSAYDYDESPAVVGVLSDAQSDTVRRLSRVVGWVKLPIISHFSLVQDDCSTRLVAEAKMAAVKIALQDSKVMGLPILASTVPARCGGRLGPHNYVDIAPGEIQERAVAEIQPHANFISVLRLNGTQLVDWLDMSASLYNRLIPDAPEQLLFGRDTPAYKRETVYGVSYEVDLTQPARFSQFGALVRPDASRIKNLTWRDQTVAPDQEFLLATNDFRVGGGGNYPGIAPQRLVCLPPIRVRDALTQYLARGEYFSDLSVPSWRFATMEGVRAVFETGPGAVKNLKHATPTLAPLGQSDDGFLQYRIDLGA
ncbi:MAG: 5'-nucleotidase C-terminal domain-containing protein [Shimia sp.]|jgi:2',3'-cyclic-nucleotide 2'-phosphodiesterase/3'-nucleotidase|uniref:5'-nucleotidase C-terminal domain-containing protein n=1 Tax=Shimia sp. TaxID=1954381 RepID=UPI004058B9C1